jgi:hypothetical protein
MVDRKAVAVLGALIALTASCGYKPRLSSSGARLELPRLGRIHRGPIVEPGLRPCLRRRLQRDLALRGGSAASKARLQIFLLRLEENRPLVRGQTLAALSLRLTLEARIVGPGPSKRRLSGLLTVSHFSRVVSNINASERARRLAVEQLCKKATDRITNWAETSVQSKR